MFTKLCSSFVSVLLLALPCMTLAAPKSVQSFDKAAWLALKQPALRPSVVVFTTTDCAFCPDVIDALARDVRLKRKTHAKLFVVVMDGAGKSKALLTNAHYRRADALFAFDGQEMALRDAVNPDWRGLTPYVALVSKSGETRFVTGRPSDNELDAFLVNQ
jgi:hypothetical protein